MGDMSRNCSLSSDPSIMRKDSFNHRERFRLMQYQEESNPDATIEWLWNSRDGVTPFVIKSRDGKYNMQHISWQDDIDATQYVPNVGQRVFIDLTKERLEEYIRSRIENYWEHPSYPLSDHFSTKEDAFIEMMKDGMKDVANGAPDIVTCTEELQKKFITEREERRSRLRARRHEHL